MAINKTQGFLHIGSRLQTMPAKVNANSAEVLENGNECDAVGRSTSHFPVHRFSDVPVPHAHAETMAEPAADGGGGDG